MGMAASQARYLSLTARKTNVEYEGQQVNQERTALANQSAGLFNQMLALEVPTPPVATDYTKTYYTFTEPSRTESTVIEAIYIDDEKTAEGNGIYATVEMTEKSTYLSANPVTFTKTAQGSNSTYTINPPAENSKNYTINIGTAGPYTITGPIKNTSVTKAINDSYKEQTGGTDNKYADDEYYFQFTVPSTGLTYYIPAGAGTEPNPDTFFTTYMGTNAPNLEAYSVEGAAKSERTSQNVRLNQANDGTGRYESLTVLDENGNPTGETYILTQQTVQDEEAYDAAMATYTAEKAIYEKTVADINAQTTVIQQQDKTLELHLDQLDTEQQAIQTEMDAVKKVIDKNIEETFKTFA